MGWIDKQQSGQEVLQCQELNNELVVQAFATRGWGNLALHTGDVPARVIERRQIFLKSLGLQLRDLVAGEQTHGIKVRLIEEGQKGSGAVTYATALSDTDALVTKTPGVILATFTADCLPIFIFDPLTPAIALIHAGWRGSLNLIIPETISKMVQLFQTKPEECLAAIGPGIGRECFAVKQDLAERFFQVCPEAVWQKKEEYFVDLPAFNSYLLKQQGFNPQRLFVANNCTVCEKERFFSYRGEGGITGRMMGVISLKPGVGEPE